jgi:hypothetical protein
MNRAKVPVDAAVLIELGTQRPLEVAFAPFVPFQILWVVTDGKVQRKFLWVTVRKTGIYVASGGPHSTHTSYHRDGTFHWKVKNHKQPIGRRHPLPEIPEPVLIQNATTMITDQALALFELAKFNDQAVDKVVYLDNRMLPDAIFYQVWAVPPFRHYAVNLLTEWPAQIHVVTHTNPWIEVVIYEQGNRRNK